LERDQVELSLRRQITNNVEKKMVTLKSSSVCSPVINLSYC